MAASTSAACADPSPRTLTISMSGAGTDGSVASRGGGSLRRMFGGTFQYGLNST